MRVVIHKEGFAIEAFTFFIEIVMKTKREFFSIFKLKKMENNYVKVRRKWEMKKVEKIRKRRKRLCTNDYLQGSEKRDLGEVVIYTKEIKEKKERRVKNTYLVWLMTYLETFACSTFASEAFNA